SIAAEGEELKAAGGSFRLELQEPFYVGIGVCSHNDDVVETGMFSKVELSTLSLLLEGGAKPKVVSTLETVRIGSKGRGVGLVTGDLIEAPNWTRDGTELIYNSKGRLWRVAATGGVPNAIDTGFAVRCNNDHGISPDGKLLAISDQSQEQKRSTIY